MKDLSSHSWHLVCERSAQEALHLAMAEQGQSEVTGPINDRTILDALNVALNVCQVIRQKASVLLENEILLSDDEEQIFGVLMRRLPDLAAELLDPVRALLQE